jgi:hypothetical protein
VNEHAAFSDGRYCFNVVAETQDGHSRRSVLLPSSDCTADNIELDPNGVLVDNYVPYIDSVIVYQVTGGNGGAVLFRGGDLPPFTGPHSESFPERVPGNMMHSPNAQAQDQLQLQVREGDSPASCAA